MFRSRKLINTLIKTFHSSAKLFATPHDAHGKRVFTEEEYKNNFLRGWVDGGGKQSDAEQHLNSKHVYTDAHLQNALDEEMGKTHIYITKESAYDIWKTGYNFGKKSAQSTIQQQYQKIVLEKMEKSKNEGYADGLSAAVQHHELRLRLQAEAKREALKEAQPDVKRIQQEIESLTNSPNHFSEKDEIKKIKYETRLFKFSKDFLKDLPISYRIYRILEEKNSRTDRIRVKDWLGDYKNFHSTSYQPVSELYFLRLISFITISLTLGIPWFIINKNLNKAESGETKSQKKSREETDKNCETLLSYKPSDYNVPSFTAEENNLIQQCKNDCDKTKDFHQQMKYEMRVRRGTSEGNTKQYGLRKVDNIYDDKSSTHSSYFFGKKKQVIEANSLLSERIHQLDEQIKTRGKKQAYNERIKHLGFKPK